MEGTGEQEENGLDGDINDSYKKLRESASKSDKFKVDESDRTEINDERALRSALQRSKIDSDTTNPSR